MGDKKPKKNSSGNSDAHKAKNAKSKADRPPLPASDQSKSKKK